MNVADGFRRWAERHPQTSRLALVVPAVLLGALIVETGRVDGIEPGLWSRGAAPATILYGLVGGVGAVLLFFFGWMVWAMLAMGALWMQWIVRLPGSIGRWARNVGVRGMAGYGLLGTYAMTVLFALGALGGFRVVGVRFWIDALIGVGFVSVFGGVLGGLTLVVVAGWLRNLVARRLPEPSDHWPTLRVLLPVGFVAGSWLLWQWSGTDGLMLRAPGAGLDWVTEPIALGVVHGYLASVAVLGWATQALRVGARLLPWVRPEKLVWHRGGIVPRRPRESHWSPEPIIGFRGWDVSEGYLVGHHGQSWKEATFLASCGIGHRRPEWQCNCGVYAHKTPDDLHGVVVGKVAMTGIVIEHEDGYRAERARIVELWVPGDLEEWARQTYPGVSVHSPRPVLGR